jgi:D-alanine--poly(phosphoribitol) ligase subunit 1
MRAITNLWEAFEAAAGAHAAREALYFADGSLTFSVLSHMAGRVARRLADYGIRKGDVVAIQLPKRRDTYAIWLGCLRQGAIYVFMDPRNPPARNQQIFARLTPKLVFTTTDQISLNGKTIRLPDGKAGDDWIAALPSAEPPCPASIHGLDPAYVMFTSGSTGEPKGAVIPHQGILSLMRWVQNSICEPSASRFLNINPLHFDNAVYDLYGGLANGATLVPVETSVETNPARWVRTMREGRASMIFAVPTLFQTLYQLNLLRPDLLPDARIFMFGGEGFSIDTLREFYADFRGQARLINVYGPTETSCICSSLEIDDATIAEAGSSFPSIGHMHLDFEHAILDDDDKPVAIGQTGELWIGGANVGLGYFNDYEQTEAKFRHDPRQTKYRSIWYRTGDLVRADERGLLWFAGRVDNQVKIRGHRVELEEIDLAIESVAGVRRAISVAVAGESGPELRAAFTAASSISIDAIRLHCRERLPAYMQPTLIRQVEMLPQNANGKVDRRAIASLLKGETDKVIDRISVC